MVLEDSTQSPVNQTGERTRKRGFHRMPWMDIIMGRHQTESPTQPLGALVQGGQNVLGGLGEGLAEGLQTVGGLIHPGREDSLGHRIVGDTDDPSTFGGATRDFIETGLMAFGHEGPDGGDGDGGGQAGQGQSGVPDHLGGSDILDDPNATTEQLLGAAQSTIQLDERLQEILESGELTESSQFAVNEARANLAEQLDQLQLDLEKQRQQLGIQDVLFEYQADQLGFDPDLAPLDEAIQQEGGIGLQSMQAIRDIANDASLSAAEKSEAVDLVTARQEFSGQIVNAIDEMVVNRDDLQKLTESSDKELAQHLGADTFFDPMFPNVMELDPAARYMQNFTDTLYKTEIGDVVAGMDDAQLDLFQNAIQAVQQFGARSEEAAPFIRNLEQATGTDFETWRNELDAAKVRADNSEEAFEAAAEEGELEPYSEAMTYAIANAGQGLIEAGVPAEQVALIANYPGLHAIIDVKSEGVAGKEREGTIRGVGGLTEDMYLQLMGEEWTPDRGMEWELQALLLYIMRGFSGDPVEAMDFYRTTGEWGGVPSMEEGTPSE